LQIAVIFPLLGRQENVIFVFMCPPLIICKSVLNTEYSL